MNDPKQLLVYANKTNIDIHLFIKRQDIFRDKLRGLAPDNLEAHKTLYFRVVKNR